jgi:spore coat polysaccharide biosynthesis protein SpsF
MSLPIKVGIITQARLGSSRLPGKVLLKAGGKALLAHHIERLQQSGHPVIVATTTEKIDDAIVEFCEHRNLPYFRGDEQNVLSRFYGCAVRYGLKVIVRVTSDCPLIDGTLIKTAVENYFLSDDPRVYASNCLVRTYPRGLDFEIFSFVLLEEAYLHAFSPVEKEHVTPYLYQNKPESIIIKHVTDENNNSQFRITLDTVEDYHLIKILIEEHQANTLPSSEIIELLKNRPELPAINAHVEQNKL